MKKIRCFAAVFCLLLLLAGCAGEPKVKRTIEGMKTYAELSSNSDDYFAPEEAVLVELGTE